MAATTSAPAATVVAAVTKPEAVETVNLTASPAAANGDVSTTTAPAKLPPATSAENAAPATTANKSAEQAGQSTGGGSTFQGQQDDFYNAIFYFSGMGSVIGSALSEGVYVGEQYRKNAIDADEIERSTAAWRARIGFTPGAGLNTGGRQITREDVVIKARGQAQNLSSDFGKLQTLLESLPVFTGNADQLPPPVSSGAANIDQPIHGELYFRCKERFPVQPGSGARATPSLQSQPSPFDSVSIGSGTGSHVTSTEEHSVRRRKNYDDAVLADVARATVESFPLMPVPRPSQPGSRGSTTPVPDGNESIDQRRARRRDVNAAGGSLVGKSPSPGPAGSAAYYTQPEQCGVAGSQSRAGVKSWQMSHVRPFEDGVY